MRKVFVPHDYQEEALDHVYNTPRGALWMPMGGGKSVTTLTALDNLALFEEVYPILILGPRRVVRDTWPNEVAKWEHFKHLKLSVVLGTAAERKAALKVPADIYAINYDNLPWLVELYGEDWPFRTIVADEVTKLKGLRLRQGSKRAGALRPVAHTKVNRFLGLTGTPNPNGLQDLWGPTWFYDGGKRLGRSYSAFEQRWFTKGFDGYSLVAQEYAQDQIMGLLKDICLTVRGLPVDEPILNDIEVDLLRPAMVQYRELEREMFLQLESNGEEINAVNAAVLTGKCHQFANGALYHEDKSAWTLVHDAKIEALQSIVEEAAGAPVLVGYNFVSDKERILKAFGSAVRDLGTDAGMDAALRGEGQVWVGHPASMGHGVDGLQHHCNIVALFSLTWNLEHYMQLIERVGPMRQKQAGFNRPVTVHRIITKGTIDETIRERITSKRTVQEVMLEAMERKAR